MKYFKIAMLVFVMAVVFGRVVAMLPPETFRDPIFASSQADEDDGDSGYTKFA